MLVIAVALFVLAVVRQVFWDGSFGLPSFWPARPHGWPHGVLVDDDARWSWRRRRHPDAPVVERLHGRVTPRP